VSTLQNEFPQIITKKKGDSIVFSDFNISKRGKVKMRKVGL